LERPILKIGTCSWKYPSWEGLVYSRAKPENYLSEYARKYNTVEIDQWFWSLHADDKISLPRPEVVAKYNASVPDGFMFSVKAPNSLTLTRPYASKTKVNPYFLDPALLEKFLNSLAPFGNKLGPIIFQFEYLNKQKMPNQGVFQEKLAAFFKQAPKGFVYAIEIRNPNYLNPVFFSFLKSQQLSYVFMDGYYMPPVYEVYKIAKTCISGFAVVRLLGPDRQGIEKQSAKIWNKRIAPRDKSLSAIAQMINDLLSREVDIAVNVNNHYEGSAPLTIKQLLELL